MSLTSGFLGITAVLAIVFLNGFFVAAEFAIVKVRTTQIEPLAKEGSNRARIAQHIVAHLDVYLSSCQLGVTMTSLGLGWVGEPFVARLLEPLLSVLGAGEALVHTASFVVGFGLITFLHIVMGEQAPKWVAIQRTRSITLAVARPLDLFTRLFRPAIWLLNASAKLFLKALGIKPAGEGELAQSEEELRLILSRGKALTSMGKNISLRAMRLRDRTVREIMVPRTSVVFLSTDKLIEANVALAIENQFTRYPLCEKNLDNVLGMIHIKDLFRLQGERGEGSRLLDIRRDILFVPETKVLEEILTLFLAKRILMAIAVDEYGGTAGMVTLEDVLEELVGDIRDEFDVEPGPALKINENEFLIDGSMALREFAAQFGIPASSRDVVTVSGYVFQVLGRIPERGTVVPLGKWQGTIEVVERRKVKTLRLTRAPEPPPQPARTISSSGTKRKKKSV
jgi:CBS domain containing-hemolysin-like protein